MFVASSVGEFYRQWILEKKTSIFSDIVEQTQHLRFVEPTL